MILRFFYFLVLSLAQTSWVYADFDLQQLGASVGMVNSSYTENPSALDPSEDDPNGERTASSGTISTIALNAQYEFFQNSDYSYFANAVVPIVGSSSDRLFLAGLGANFYLFAPSSKGVFKEQENMMLVIPRWRYYWGVDAAIGYMVYTTKTAVKSDLLFDLGAHVGVNHSFNDQYALKVELGLSRGTGVATTTLNIKGFVGVTYYMGN